MSHLKFETFAECENAIKEIDKRRNLTGNITTTFATPQLDIDDDYVIPKPPSRALKEVKKLVKPISITNEEGTFQSIEIVKKVLDEVGKDITKYDSSEYELVQQEKLESLFTYEIKEKVSFPIVEEVKLPVVKEVELPIVAKEV